MEQSLVERILKIKNTNEKEILLSLISQEKEKFKQLASEDAFIRQAILDFVIIYNPLNLEWKNETVADFCKKLIQFYDEGNNISIPILNLMNDYFKAPSYFKVLIQFEKGTQYYSAEIETPSITNITEEGAEQLTFSVDLTPYKVDDNFLTITGYKLYEKTGEDYNLLKTINLVKENREWNNTVTFTQEAETQKTYVIVTYVLLRNGEALPSSYSNEITIDNRTPEEPIEPDEPVNPDNPSDPTDPDSGSQNPDEGQNP